MRRLSLDTILVLISLFLSRLQGAVSTPSPSLLPLLPATTATTTKATNQAQSCDHSRLLPSLCMTVTNLRGGQQQQIDMMQSSIQSIQQHVASFIARYPIIQETLLPAVSMLLMTTKVAVQDLTPPQRILLAVTLLFGMWLGNIEPFWRSYRTTSDVPNKRFGPKVAPLKGRVASVTDGDTIRLYHTPLPWQRLPKHVTLTTQTMAIRLCTIDAPETPKFGKAGQPFGEEAKSALKRMVGHGKVYVRLLRKDQYGRAVGQVWIKGWRGQHIHMDAYMLKKGLAEVYEGQGAVYGPRGKPNYLDLEKQARQKRVGIWSLGDQRESASDYKRKYK